MSNSKNGESETFSKALLERTNVALTARDEVENGTDGTETSRR